MRLRSAHEAAADRRVRRWRLLDGGRKPAARRPRPVARRGAERPRVCFLPTASGDADHYIVRFYRAFPPARCDSSHISLFRRDHGGDPREHLLAQDVIYVGGGSVLSLLGTWRAHGLDDVLRECWERGVVLCGVSAGSLCWFAESVTAFHGRAAPRRRARAAAALQLRALRRRAGAARGVPALRRRRDALGLRGRGRRGAALRRDGAARGRQLAADGARLPRRAGQREAARGPVPGDGAGPARRWRPPPEDDPRARRRRLHGTRGDEALDLYALSLARGRVPRICLLPTASGDQTAQVTRVLRGVRRPRVRGDAPVAVPSRRAADRRPRAPARPGRHLRRRRLAAQPPRDLARARPRRGPARGLPPRDRPRRRQRGRDVLVRARA